MEDNNDTGVAMDKNSEISVTMDKNSEISGNVISAGYIATEQNKNSRILNRSNDVAGKKDPLYIVKSSKIHGLGLFATQKIPACQFLLNYEGEIIGKCVSDKREREYKQGGINSVYMFKIDDDIIIDATFVGNEARYMNHSCRPNCYSILDFKGKKIMYYTEREIEEGEELTLNYYFSEEDTNERCNCGMEGCASQSPTQQT